jgi:hypothetical protein
MYGETNQWVANHIEIYHINLRLRYLLMSISVDSDLV